MKLRNPGVALLATFTVTETKFSPATPALKRVVTTLIPSPVTVRFAPLVGRLTEATPTVTPFWPCTTEVGSAAHPKLFGLVVLERIQPIRKSGSNGSTARFRVFVVPAVSVTKVFVVGRKLVG